MEYIYACIIPFRQFSPCTALLCIPQTWRNCPGAKLLFTPEQQGREVEHSSGALRTTPHTTDAAHFPGCHQKVRLVLFLRSFTERMRLTFCLCHMVYKTTRKEYGILQTRHTDVCLDKADGVCRREVGTARLPAVTLPCLDCLIIHIHSYLYCYTYYFISILLHYHIDVLTYCYIVSFLHYRISA